MRVPASMGEQELHMYRTQYEELTLKADTRYNNDNHNVIIQLQYLTKVAQVNTSTNMSMFNMVPSEYGINNDIQMPITDRYQAPSDNGIKVIGPLATAD
jgi:hypothetical protein